VREITVATRGVKVEAGLAARERAVMR
jgi:hypothetical protein